MGRGTDMAGAQGLAESPDWVPVLALSEQADTWLGILGDEWRISRSVRGPGEPIGARTVVGAWPLLERDPDAVKPRIAAARGVAGADAFPYGDLLRSAMRSGTDYWAALALDWAEVVGLEGDVAEAADDLREASWASQRTRQRARQLARRHGQGGE